MAMSDWQSGFVTWRTRRRRFAEEWAFHRDAAIAEFESMGWSRSHSRKAAKRRMGSRLRYRSEALAAIGGDLPGLVRLLPIQSVTRTAFFVPAMLVLGVALALLLNPARNMAFQCIRAMLFREVLPKAERIIPSMPGGVVPVSLTGAMLRTLAVAGLGWAVANLAPRRSLRAFLYAVIVLCGIVLGAAVFWVTGMQILARKSWGHDGIQGFALLAFLFGFVGMLYLAVWQWWIDVENRCPYCLRLPGMPETRGNPHHVLLDPLEIESICFRGHGVLLESRWRRRFQTTPEAVL